MRHIRPTSTGPPSLSTIDASGCGSLMQASVIALTGAAQVHLHGLGYALCMSSRDLDTPASRIAHAIGQCGKTLETLAQEVGCTHAALSQWQTGSTNAANIKAALLSSFADATGTDVRWLLTGNGPAVSRYILTDELARLSAALKVLEDKAPWQVETVVRMVEAAAESADGKPRDAP